MTIHITWMGLLAVIGAVATVAVALRVLYVLVIAFLWRGWGK